MKHIANIVGAIFLFIGFVGIFLGELVVAAWCIYDFINLLSGVVTFTGCLLLVFTYVFRGIIAGIVSLTFLFIGWVLYNVD